MKIRTDFVTNSSSASFTVELQLKSDRDEAVEFSASTTRDCKRDDREEYYDGSDPYAALFKHGWPVEALDIDFPGGDGNHLFLVDKPLAEMESLEDVIEDMLRLVEVTTYGDGIAASGFRFFVAGNPVCYDSREDLEATIKRLGGEVTDPYHADLVVYCGKERFCERWPEGYAYLALSEADQAELDEAEGVIEREMREAAKAFDDGLFTFGIHTGACDMDEEVQAEAKDGWKGWILYEWMHNLFIPILSEREFAVFDPNGPAGNGGPSAMPGAVKALAEKCVEHGITRDNLRIIGAKVIATPFGDSVWEIDDFARQWDMNIPAGDWDYVEEVTRRAGSLENRSDIYDVDTSWQDTVWWPFRGEVRGVPYSSVVSGDVERSTVRHLDLSEFRGGRITKMRRGFHGFENLQSINLSGVDTSLVTDMSSLFTDCRNLRELNLSPLNTSQVTNMSSMFNGCRDLLSLDLSCLDTSQVTDMSNMFKFCGNLKSINLTGIDTSRVTNMWGMFNYCKSLEELDLSGFDTSQVNNMGYMFDNCDNLERIDLSNFDTSSVIIMQSMFAGCHKLRSLDLSGFDTSQVSSLFGMFNGCIELRELDISRFDTSQVENMLCMFWNCNKLRNLDVSSFDTSRVTNMNSMFVRCANLRSLDLSNFDTSQVTDMGEMFLGCSRLRSLDLSGFDASQLKNAVDMFEGCDSLERWSVSETWPVGMRGAIPEPTASCDKWWSERDGRWMSVSEIRERGPVADTYTSHEPGA